MAKTLTQGPIRPVPAECSRCSSLAERLSLAERDNRSLRAKHQGSETLILEANEKMRSLREKLDGERRARRRLENEIATPNGRLAEVGDLRRQLDERDAVLQDLRAANAILDGMVTAFTGDDEG